jgi:methyl-galactoside transport system ATP-binding protein
MRDGQLVGDWPADELDTDTIVKRMVGREMSNRFPAKNHTPGGVKMEVKGFTSANPHSFKDVSFSLHQGEILGIGGLVGAQRTELVETIFGLRKKSSGEIFIDGQKVDIQSPDDAISHNMALLTEERRVSGIFPKISVLENITIAKQTADPKVYTDGLFLNNKKRQEDAVQYVKAFEIKTPDIKAEIQNLSGGNQQKAVLARWMLLTPQILILDEPTRGIDVGAKYEIYSLMEQMAQEGKAVIMISSEMPELLGMSDRIAVMCEGHLSGILDGADATDEKVMFLASTYQKAE